jgi:DNA repair exonuclease SbcCD nuclease subunit
VKILSTGDWHFNAGYDNDVSDSVGQIIKYVYQNEVDLVVITGDVYERASDPDPRNLAIACIQGLGDKVPVIIVRGNHDAPGDLKVYNQIRSKHEIKAFEAPDIWAMPMAGESGILIHIMPWLTKARWQSLHVGATKEEGDRTVSQLALEYLKNNVALHAGYKHILAGHMTIAGAKAQNHQQMGADGITLGLYDITEAGFFAAMLGHIHLMQALDGPTQYYNGSVAALDYGEVPEKFFSILDTETGQVEWVQLKTVHRQDVWGAWTSTGISMDDVGIERLSGARVRFNLRVEGGDNVPAAKAQVEAWGKQVGALELKINPQVIPVTKVRAVEISKARSLSDKLKQYWVATGETASADMEGMLNKLAQLEDECSL